MCRIGYVRNERETNMVERIRYKSMRRNTETSVTGILGRKVTSTERAYDGRDGRILRQEYVTGEMG